MTETHDLEQAIRERAYFLWEKEGSPEGREAEFWERARQLELQAQEGAQHPPAMSTPHDRTVDTAMEHSFPASDPPARTGITGPGS